MSDAIIGRCSTGIDTVYLRVKGSCHCSVVQCALRTNEYRWGLVLEVLGITKYYHGLVLVILGYTKFFRW